MPNKPKLVLINAAEREGIEEEWQDCYQAAGESLCRFVKNHTPLKPQWDKVWKRSAKVYISGHFVMHPDWQDLSYLCRALSLNILLDDNQVD